MGHRQAGDATRPAPRPSTHGQPASAGTSPVPSPASCCSWCSPWPFGCGSAAGLSRGRCPPRSWVNSSSPRRHGGGEPTATRCAAPRRRSSDLELPLRPHCPGGRLLRLSRRHRPPPPPSCSRWQSAGRGCGSGCTGPATSREGSSTALPGPRRAPGRRVTMAIATGLCGFPIAGGRTVARRWISPTCPVTCGEDGSSGDDDRASSAGRSPSPNRAHRSGCPRRVVPCSGGARQPRHPSPRPTPRVTALVDRQRCAPARARCRLLP